MVKGKAITRIFIVIISIVVVSVILTILDPNISVPIPVGTILVIDKEINSSEQLSKTPTPKITDSSLPLTPTKSISPTPIITLTPLEPVDNPEEYIKMLIETNGGCDLPCWWGIVPGETDWETAKQFLATFANEIIENYGEPIDEETIKQGYFNFISFQVPGEDNENYIRFRLENSIIEIITISQLYEDSPPHQVIEDYGLPDKIWLHAHPTPGRWYVSLDFLYSERGIVVGYSTHNAVEQDSIIRACFDRGTVLNLFPEGNEIDRQGVYPNQDFKITVRAFSDSSEAEAQTFFESFINPELEPCLDTQVEVWYP